MKRNLAASTGWMRRLWIVLLLCAGLLAACGGGVGTGGTGAFASGPISGFGSIIVNDVHYDESLARVEDDDGSLRSRADLRLGTVVEIDSDAVRDNRAVASRVRIVSQRIGRVDAVGAQGITVNGLPIRVNGGTVFDERFVGGLAGVAVGTLVEVHGFPTATPGEVLATRIESRDTAAVFKFRGEVLSLDTRTRTFRIGTQTFAYAQSVDGRDQLANGAYLRVLTAPMRDGPGRWVVTQIGNGLSLPGEGLEVKANGLITLFESLSSFQLGPWIVDASAAEIEDGPLGLGLRVKVEGFLRGGVLVAREVRVLGSGGDDDDGDDDDGDDDDDDDEDGDSVRDAAERASRPKN